MKKYSSQTQNRISAFFMLFPTFLVIIGFYFYPAIYNLELSFTDMKFTELRTGGDWVGLSNYIEFFTRNDSFNLVFNTVFWLTAVSVFFRMIIGLLFALLLHSKMLRSLRLSTIARLFLLVPWATPPVVAVIAWRWMMDPSGGPINSFLLKHGIIAESIAFTADLATVWPSIITIIVWNTTPLVAVSILASLQTIPDDLNEAAELDGASRWQQFRFVTLPYLMPTMSVLTLMSIIWTFNNFLYVWLTTFAGPGTFTNVMATEVYMRAFIDMRLGYSSAVGITMAVALTIFGVLYFRVVGLDNMQDKVG